MRRIVDGKAYDTETAELLAEFRYGYPGEDDHYQESLYRTAGNGFFLACNGAEDSPYALLLREDIARPGADIVPLTDAEVLRWLEDYEYTEVIERVFGTLPEAGDGMVMVWSRVSKDVQQQLADAAERAGQSPEAWIARAIERALE